MTEIVESTIISGVKFAKLQAFSDERGRFMETFRKEWFPERSWAILQANRSDSRAGVLRGLHFHHHQVDYWYVPQGTIRVALADLRTTSPTCGATEVVEIGNDNQVGIFIPTGVAHGFLALSDATVTYLVDNYYSGADEHGVAWNDPELNINWDTENPVLSVRDRRNPRLKEIPAEDLPA
jgi:dTDP-4-dehydrorhamnose 3,5-epimerase